MSTDSPEKWLKRNVEIITITSKTENTWPTTWVLNEVFMGLPSYFVGIKINNAAESIGWILLEPNQNTGEIKLINSDFSSNDSMVIDPT